MSAIISGVIIQSLRWTILGRIGRRWLELCFSVTLLCIACNNPMQSATQPQVELSSTWRLMSFYRITSCIKDAYRTYPTLHVRIQNALKQSTLNEVVPQRSQRAASACTSPRHLRGHRSVMCKQEQAILSGLGEGQGGTSEPLTVIKMARIIKRQAAAI